MCCCFFKFRFWDFFHSNSSSWREKAPRIHSIANQSPEAISFIRALILIMRVLPSCPNHLPKAPPPNPIILGVKISTYEFWGDTNIWSRGICLERSLLSLAQICDFGHIQRRLRGARVPIPQMSKSFGRPQNQCEVRRRESGPHWQRMG